MKMIWLLLPPLNPTHLNCTPLITNTILLTKSTVTSQVLSAPFPPIHAPPFQTLAWTPLPSQSPS